MSDNKEQFDPMDHPLSEILPSFKISRRLSVSDMADTWIAASNTQDLSDYLKVMSETFNPKSSYIPGCLPDKSKETNNSESEPPIELNFGKNITLSQKEIDTSVEKIYRMLTDQSKNPDDWFHLLQMISLRLGIPMDIDYEHWDVDDLEDDSEED